MILDASVAAKWFLKGEKYEDKSLSLRQEYEAGEIDLSAPSLLSYEVCNGIWERKDIASEAAAQLAELACEYLNRIALQPGPESYRRALSNARVWDITVYDSSYATMSEELKRPLITADDDLRAHLAKTSLPVIFLADYKAS